MTEIEALEERLRQAELRPDPEFFEEFLAHDAVLVSERNSVIAKSMVVAAHRAAQAPPFTTIEMSDLKMVDHGDVAVVTCTGRYEGPELNVTLHFMRVWLKKNGRWQIVAGSISR